jgi:tRNA threonylcarbamoyladenosine biosynthesis protein TsaE
LRLGELLGSKLTGGEAIDLVSDLGGGKTTFTRGMAKGFDSQDNVASPTFTLNKIYKGRSGLEIHHFDFYRLSEPGIIADQLAESVSDDKVVTVVEWSDIVKDVLPPEHLTIKFEPLPSGPDERRITFIYHQRQADLVHWLQTEWEEVEP